MQRVIAKCCIPAPRTPTHGAVHGAIWCLPVLISGLVVLALWFLLSSLFLSCMHNQRGWVRRFMVLSWDPCRATRCCGADGNITLALIPCKIQSGISQPEVAA